MGSNRTDPAPVRVRRAWIHVGGILGLATSLGALASGVLLEGEPTRRPGAEHVAVVSVGPTPPEEPARAPELPPPPALEPPTRPAPRSLGEVLGQTREVTSSELARWVADEQVPPTARYGALRRLEQEDPPVAVDAALDVLDDVTPLVRLNAIAVLSRSDDPRAVDALARLDERSRRLALALDRTTPARKAR